jgi:hypothetical protein
MILGQKLMHSQKYLGMKQPYKQSLGVKFDMLNNGIHRLSNLSPNQQQIIKSKLERR